MAVNLSRLISGLSISPALKIATRCPRILMSSHLLQCSRQISFMPLRCHKKIITPSLPASSNLTRQMSLMTLNKTHYNSPMLNSSLQTIQPHRSKVIYSWRKGKAKTVKAVVRRFYRLDWGVWIRPRAGRHKKLWRKRGARKFRLRQHVFCNGTQSKLLDKMVTKFWTRKNYYVDDPYDMYQKRTNFDLIPEKPKQFYP